MACVAPDQRSLGKVIGRFFKRVDPDQFFVAAKCPKSGFKHWLPELAANLGIRTERSLTVDVADRLEENDAIAVAPARRVEPAFVRKLLLHSVLTIDERISLAHVLSLDVRHVRSRSPLVSSGSTSGKLAVLMEGWACCYRLLSGGARQMVACYLPGDVCDIHDLVAPRPNTVIMLLPGSSVARLSRDVVARIQSKQPRIALALWKDAQIASSIEREWLVSVTRRDARARVAHLLCEFIARADAVGELEDDRLSLPILQTDFADACGLTPAHTNRILRTLREDGLALWHDHAVTVPDRAALAAAGGFCPAYLGLEEKAPRSPARPLPSSSS